MLILLYIPNFNLCSEPKHTSWSANRSEISVNPFHERFMVREQIKNWSESVP
jgi:hypothetical protein